MKSCSLILLGASLLASGVLAELSYIAKMSRNGVEGPIELTPMPSRYNLPIQARSKRQTVSETENWAGAIQEEPPSGLFNTVSANWQVPTISAPPGFDLTEEAYWLYEWVGIGSSCDVIVQAGTGSHIANDTGVILLVWWYWFPDGGYTIDIPIEVGDTFFVNITATSDTTAIYYVENQSQGYAVTVEVSGGTTVCQQNVEWVVENPAFASLSVSDFDGVLFTDCLATTTTGDTADIAGTTPIYMISNYGVIVESLEINPTDLLVYYPD